MGIITFQSIVFRRLRNMTQIDIGCSLVYDIKRPTVLLLKIAASWTQHQFVNNENLTANPGLNIESCQIGPDGNRLHRVVVDPCRLTLKYDASVEVTPIIERSGDIRESLPVEMPPDVLTYLNPSRYCESDLLGRFAFEEFGQLNHGYARVQMICDWVHDHLEYTPGSTNGTTTASDVLLQRTGVCRDYSHVAISLCRGVGIPARYISGYAVDLEPPDYHGVMEAWLDGQWYLFDPTRIASPLGLVRIGMGRDAADVAFATITGTAALLEKKVWAHAPNADLSQPNNPPVSTA